MGNHSAADAGGLLSGRGPGTPGTGAGLGGAGAAALVGGVLLIGTVLAGNSLVCVSVASERTLQTPTNYFIVSLAAADLLLAILVLPLFVFSEVQGGVWPLSPRLCDALMAMDVLLCTASIFSLCAISVDRFVAVTVPLRYSRQGRRQLLLIGATWLLSCAVAAPVLCGLSDVQGRDPAVCRLEARDYVVYSSVCSFFLPCPLMVLLYWATLRGLRRWGATRHAKLHSRAPRGPSGPGPPVPELVQSPLVPDCALPAPSLSQSPSGPGPLSPDLCPRPSSPRTSAPRRHPRRGALAAALTAGLRKEARQDHRQGAQGNESPAGGSRCLPGVPFFVVHITRALCPACFVPSRLVSAVTWLGYVNSALNPIIYTVFNPEFCIVFRKSLRLSC